MSIQITRGEMWEICIPELTLWRNGTDHEECREFSKGTILLVLGVSHELTVWQDGMRWWKVIAEGGTWGRPNFEEGWIRRVG